MAAKEEFSIVFVVKVVDRINGTEGNVLDLLKIDEYNLLGIGSGSPIFYSAECFL